MFFSEQIAGNKLLMFLFFKEITICASNITPVFEMYPSRDNLNGSVFKNKLGKLKHNLNTIKLLYILSVYNLNSAYLFSDWSSVLVVCASKCV